ncbi:hypothetical protein E2562_037262 [Oryza meyeriana var. granulata]|uniref:protein-disulfide reductase n=1 Tax=Oryza meyeriana var. granulata TaxID=110450 RepID=A0A6G1ECG7_9ORYZ|nr:hypothetical protein E2562_037262 [Oryza meyeriana var. granulata]
MEKATDCGITALLGAAGTGFLVLSTSEQVDASSIRADIVAFYFAARRRPACRRFTRRLEEAYMSWVSVRSFEVVFVSCDEGEEAFDAHLAMMPPEWPAVPFSDSGRRQDLVARFNAIGEVPRLVVLDAKTGEAITDRGVELLAEHGAAAYPFTPARVDELERELAARRDQTIHTVLATPSSNYVISSKGDKVPISQLEGKHVGVFFTTVGYAPVEEFTPVLVEMYQKLKQAGGEYYDFEVVAVSLDNDEPSFAESFARTPWLAVPYDDGETRERLSGYFDSRQLPRLALIGPDGKTVSNNVAGVVQEHGAEAWEGFPFSPEKMEVLTAKVKARDASLTLESLLVAGDLDFVLDQNGGKVPVVRLIGKTVLLYFLVHWCNPCRRFLPSLIEEYVKMREETSGDVEVVFVSSDHDQRSYDGHRVAMPWLALPFADDGLAAALRKALCVDAVPSLVAVGPYGEVLARAARTAVAVHGAGAYPFTEERLEALEREVDGVAAAEGWADRVSKHPFEEDELERRKGDDVGGAVAGDHAR